MAPVIEDARVDANERAGADYFLLTLKSPAVASSIAAGQFVMAEVQPGHDPLLRRPFSAHRVRSRSGEPPDTIEILIKCVGRGTRKLAGLRPGDSLSLVGPLGRGFSFPGPPRTILVAGGGCGIAPLPFAAQTFLAQGHQVEIFYGVQKKAHLVGRDALASLGAPLHISTDDGSSGHCGPVTDLVRGYLEHAGGHGVSIAACGPTAMLAAVKKAASEFDVPCQVSLETVMACGFGVCLGCSVQGATPGGGYPLACTDGPVFDAEHIEI